MKLSHLLFGSALALTSAFALAQDAPESILPPGFDQPAPAPAPPPAPAPKATSAPAAPSRPSSGSAAPSVSNPVVQAVPSSSGGGASSPGSSSGSGSSSAGSGDGEVAARLPTLEELERMTPDELQTALGLTPSFDIPKAKRRSASEVGVIGRGEGGFAPGSLATQRASLVRATLAGNRGRLVSRWGHILLRRALASRLDAPADMKPGDFLALRAALLLRMGEAEAARAMVQDLDTGFYTNDLTNAAFDAYVATSDFTGMCPVLRTQKSEREDAQWETAKDICQAFRGEDRQALRAMDRDIRNETMPKIDLLLAQKYAGAAGKARRAVTIEWDEVKNMNPWRYGMALAVGIEPPIKLTQGVAGGRYAELAAQAPMLGLASRARAADVAGGTGVLSSRAMVDLYGQIYADPEVAADWNSRAEELRKAYVLKDPAKRVAAMQSLWTGAENPLARYSRQVLTAYAAARLPVFGEVGDATGDLVASMLAAGLDRDAAQWAGVVEEGSLGWALLAVGAPGDGAADAGAVDTFFDDDESVELRKSAYLLAGLAGLGRISAEDRSDFEGRLEIDLARESNWTRLLDSAARVDNEALVALLATLGMQGGTWDKMTPRNLYHIVSALRRVGLEAEARMIAAEAVARG
ncbi:MAG: hypothetical protein R3D89_05940 [Sphingomonadaceae bacterium]